MTVDREIRRFVSARPLPSDPNSRAARLAGLGRIDKRPDRNPKRPASNAAVEPTLGLMPPIATTGPRRPLQAIFREFLRAQAGFPGLLAVSNRLPSRR